MFDHAETQRLLRRQKAKGKAIERIARIHRIKVRSQAEDYCADRIIMKRFNKICKQSEQLGKEIESRLAHNEKEIGEMLLREAPDIHKQFQAHGYFA